ncbi:MAG: PqqD family protein [Deltaproteobacteria bacterium]
MTSKARFIIKEVDSDLLFYDGASDEVHILNQTARAVYNLLREGKTQEQIVEILQNTSRVSEGDHLEDDVRACIKSLIQKDLIQTR